MEKLIVFKNYLDSKLYWMEKLFTLKKHLTLKIKLPALKNCLD
jgi:hypothetical protein